MQRRFPTRKLNKADGEYLLRHALEHLWAQSERLFNVDLLIMHQAMSTIRQLLKEMEVR